MSLLERVKAAMWRPSRAVVERKEPTLRFERRKSISQRISTTWDGARVDNLVAGWITTPVPINRQIEAELRKLRARSRQLAKNDPYVRRFLQMARINVVGPTGYTFRSLVTRANGKSDQPAREAIQAAWKLAMAPGVLCSCDRYSGLDMYNLCSDQLSRDGEIILLQHTGKSQGPFGIKFRFVDPELLDVNHKIPGKNGHKVRMGIETDDRARVIAYHFHSTDTTHEHYYKHAGKGFLRIPSEFVIHRFQTEYVDQLRGFPHTAAAMFRLRMLNGYEEAELVASRGAAATMGFIVRGENGKAFEGEETIVDVDADEAALIDGGSTQEATETIEAEAGTFHYLDHGADVKTYDPNHPNSAYKDFIKAVLRAIASSLGVNYNTLANDLEGVNYSSIRSGVLEDREAWKARQEWMIEHIVSPMFNRWLEFALLSGAITLARGLPLSSANVDRYRVHKFQGRRWTWVDPLKDMQAVKLEIDERINSRSNVIRERGFDPAEIWEEIRAENEVLIEKGIPPIKSEPIQSGDDKAGADETGEEVEK